MLLKGVWQKMSSGSGYSSIILLVLMIVIFYVFMMVPENRKKKKLNEMRNSLKAGDEIVTIGGLMGRVVHVTDDTVTFETGEDQVRIQVTKWAISTNARVEAAEKKAAAEKKSGAMFGKRKAAEVEKAPEPETVEPEETETTDTEE